MYFVGAEAEGEGSDFNVRHGGRSYLATSDKLGPDNFYKPNLRGGSLEYTVDVSTAGCSCNAALYLVRGPGKNEDGSYRLSPSDDYYCDGNKVGGAYCPEFDIMEANTYAFQATPHKCNKPSDKGWYDWCDGAGSCWQKAHENPENYGYGKKIDTDEPFTVKVEFDRDSKFTTTLTQDDRTVTLSQPDCSDYYPDIAEDLEAGMVITVSMWGSDYGTMSWLDGTTGCQGGCYNQPSVYISDMKITTGDQGEKKPEDED